MRIAALGNAVVSGLAGGRERLGRFGTASVAPVQWSGISLLSPFTTHDKWKLLQGDTGQHQCYAPIEPFAGMTAPSACLIYSLRLCLSSVHVKRLLTT